MFHQAKDSKQMDKATPNHMRDILLLTITKNLSYPMKIKLSFLCISPTITTCRQLRLVRLQFKNSYSFSILLNICVLCHAKSILPSWEIPKFSNTLIDKWYILKVSLSLQGKVDLEFISSDMDKWLMQKKLTVRTSKYLLIKSKGL